MWRIFSETGVLIVDSLAFPIVLNRDSLTWTGEKMFEGRRKFKRFKGKEGAFAAFMKPNELINMGQVQNISMGGLCVRYLSTHDDNVGRSAIKIFGSNDRFIHLDRVQCRIVYEHEVPEGSWEQISTRRCGVEFENLSVKHMSQLQEFIDNFAVDENQGENP
jgi:c-di-GMP-binding flagellar brake protein YcgR